MNPYLPLAFALLIPATVWAEKPPAVRRTEQLIDAFKKVAPPGTEAGTEAGNAAAFAELDALIDFATLTEATLRPRENKLNDAQKNRFHQQMRALIRLVAYPDSGTFFRKSKLTWQPLKTRGDQTLVTIDLAVPEDDLETVLTVHWSRELRVVDVSFDGDSLVHDYQNQIARIIDKEGAAGLLKRLDERHAAASKGAGK